MKNWGPNCKRCGDEEFRIDGYCSIYCRDMAEVEDELAEARQWAAAWKRAAKFFRNCFCEACYSSDELVNAMLKAGLDLVAETESFEIQNPRAEEEAAAALVWKANYEHEKARADKLEAAFAKCDPWQMVGDYFTCVCCQKRYSLLDVSDFAADYHEQSCLWARAAKEEESHVEGPERPEYY
jgi:hypothetical protein